MDRSEFLAALDRANAAAFTLRALLAGARTVAESAADPAAATESELADAAAYAIAVTDALDELQR